MLSLSLLLLLLQTVFSYLLLLSLEMLWQIDRSGHRVPPHRMELCWCHLSHPIWHSHLYTSAIVLLGQHSLSLCLLLSLVGYHLLLLHL